MTSTQTFCPPNLLAATSKNWSIFAGRSRSRRNASSRRRKSAGEIPYCPATAKRLRYKPDIYARYGGDDVDLPTGRTPVNDPIPLWPGPVRAIQPYCAAGEPVVVFPCGCGFQPIPGIPGRHTTGVGIPRAKADLLGSGIYGLCQSSSPSPPTRTNSRALCVTIFSPRRKAEAASSRS